MMAKTNIASNDKKKNRPFSVIEAQEDKDYKVLWKERMPNLITLIEDVADEKESKALLKFETSSAPLMHKTEMIVYANGIVTSSSRSMFSSDQDFKAQLSSELLDEIVCLMKEKILQEQDSCYVVARDGYHSQLTLYFDKSWKIISNDNCQISEFSFPYRCLIFLLSLMVPAI